jgi:competence protein ComEC
MSAEDRLLFIGCFFTLGIVLQGVYSSRVVFVASCFVATCSFTLARLLVQERAGLKTYVARAQMACSAMLLGLLVMNAHVLRMQNSSELALPVSGKTREVQGIVTDMPEVDDEGKWKAVLTCETAGCDPDLKGMRILLAGTCEPASELQIQTGDIVCASGRFYLPRAPLNPGEPDMRRIMGHRRQCGTLYVRDIADIRVLGKSNPNLIQRAAMSFRETVARTSETTLIPRHARMLTGMLLGKAPSHMKLALESTGTSHLFAASGLHVGYVALAVMTLLMPLRLPAPARFAAASVFIWIYAVACGLRASIVRAALMFSFTAVPKVMGRKMSPKSALVLASVAMFAICPFAVFDIGAQLSFLTVLAIAHLFVSDRFKVLFKPLGYRLISWPSPLSVSAQAGAAPLIAWYFGVFTPIGIIANVPCVLLAGVAVLIGLYATLVGLVFPSAASALNAANSLVLLALENTVEFLSRIPFGIFEVRRPGLWFMVAYYLGIAVSGAPRRNIRALYARRNLIVLLILALSAGSVMYQTVKRPEVEVVFLAVGQGDANLYPERRR